MDDKLSPIGAWSGHVNHIILLGTNYISETAEARLVKFYMHVGYPNIRMTNHPQKGVARVMQVTSFKI